MSEPLIPENGATAVGVTKSAAVPSLSARHVSVASVNWQSVLDFTQIFRGFRLAINPAKILIALLAILMIYVAGRTFDFAWGPQTQEGEINAYKTELSERYQYFSKNQEEARSDAIRSELLLANSSENAVPFDQMDRLSKNPREARKSLKMLYMRKFSKELDDARDERKRAEEDKQRDPTQTGDPAKAEQEQRARAAKALESRMQRMNEIIGQGIFDAFLNYEIRQFDGLVDNSLAFVRVTPVRNGTPGETEIDGLTVSSGLVSKDPKRLYQSDTVVGCIANMVATGPSWLVAGSAPMHWRPEGAAEGVTTWGERIKIIGYRGLYLCSLGILGAFCLVVLALAGAVISRLSALEMGGVERAPLKDVFVFAYRRLWVFIKAPLTPLLILLAIGIVLAGAGLVGAVPYLGEILFGVFFILILAVAFVLMLLLLGILGGFNLLYPTIAVEGSDAFDAMSRSFAYVYSRPWRLLFYSVLSLLYGVVTFLFVSFSIYLVLSLAHTFTGWGVNFFGYEHGSYSGVSKLDTIWPAPDFTHMLAPANWYAMSGTEYVGSMFLHFWAYLFVCAGGGYVISYYFSSNTIIYLLLRRSVDGQGTSEVYQDEVVGNLTSAIGESTPPAAVAAAPGPTPESS